MTHGRAASAQRDPADQRNSRCSKAPPNVTDELYEEGKQLYTESKFADALDVFLQCQTAILEDRRLERWYLERQLKRENSRMVMPSPAPTPGSPSGSRRVGRRPSLLAGLGGGRYAADQASVKSPMQVELEQKIAELETADAAAGELKRTGFRNLDTYLLQCRVLVNKEERASVRTSTRSRSSSRRGSWPQMVFEEGVDKDHLRYDVFISFRLEEALSDARLLAAELREKHEDDGRVEGVLKGLM